VHCTPLIISISDVRPILRTSSSEPSGQSRSPSQRHLDVMQKFSEQLNSVSGAHGVFGQSLSSESSPQSSSRSHTQRFWMHFPFAQVNSSERHVSSVHAQGKAIQKLLCIYRTPLAYCISDVHYTARYCRYSWCTPLNNSFQLRPTISTPRICKQDVRKGYVWIIFVSFVLRKKTTATSPRHWDGAHS
jgi:hypothetical protein